MTLERRPAFSYPPRGNWPAEHRRALFRQAQRRAQLARLRSLPWRAARRAGLILANVAAVAVVLFYGLLVLWAIARAAEWILH